MTDHDQAFSGQRRSVSAAAGFGPGSAGRGPTYERVQRLLEERRARSHAQSSGQAQPAYNAANPDSLERTRMELAMASPESDESFAFDRPPHDRSPRETQELLRASYQEQRSQRHHSGADSSHTQRPWQSAAQFQVPPGHFDDDEGDEQEGFGGVPHDEYPDEFQPPRHQHPSQQQYPSDLDYPSDHEEDLRRLERSQQLDPGLGPDSPGGHHSLAELEQMLNQTVMNLAGGGDMRVPSSKDMAYGMAHADGPFDISDIWAMDSQPSGSQVSASNRQMSQSGTEASRDDGHEVNSYTAAYSQQHPQPPPPLSSGESSLAVEPSGQSEPQSGFAPSDDEATLQARIASLQTRIQATEQAQLQSHLQRQQQQQLQSVVGGGGQGAAAACQAAPARGLHPAAHHGMQSAHKGVQNPHARLARQQPQQQTPHRQQPQQQQQRTHNPEPAVLRRPASPGPQRPWSAQPRMSPRANQPARQSFNPAAARDRAEELTFQPRINPRSREMAGRLLPVDRERRLEQLSRPRNDRVEQRYEQIRQAKEQEELRDCTFQPQTGRPPSIPRLRGNQPVHERLYNVKPAWMIKRDDILREREQAVLANCTFQPKCGSRSSSATRRRPASAAAATGGDGGGGGGGGSPYVPIHQRVADLLRSRNEKLAKAQIKMELGGGSVTFQPEINRRSVHLAAERQRQQPAEVAALPASERLYRLAQEQQAGGGRRRGPGDDMGSGFRDVSAARDQQQGEQQQPSGVPAINPRSRALAESSDLPQDFLARQAYLAALGHEKRALYRSLLEESTCTFQPHLLAKTGSLGSSCGPLGPFSRTNSQRLSGSFGEGDRLSKLAYEDVQRSAALRDALEQHHYGQYTFAPHINERSRRIGRRHSLTDLYRDEERQTKLERLAAATEAQRAAECTFRPAINSRSASLGRQRRGSLVLASTECHEQANKLRSSILTEARALKEYEELKECTFTPSINRTVPKTSGPVAVPGLGRHLELRDLARRKQEADEARKAEVWNSRPKSPGPRAGFTIPRPFSFETRVMPWQIPRAQLAQQQQEQDQQQRNALAALKQQRLQQRKEAEDRRSATLRRILQETHAAATDQQLQHQQQQHQEQQLTLQPQALETTAGATVSGMQQPQQQQQQPSHQHHNHNPGRRRSVTFQSPVAGGWNDDDLAHGIAEMSGGDAGGFGADMGQHAAAQHHIGSYGGGDCHGGGDYGGAAGGYGGQEHDYDYPDSPARGEPSLRF